MSDDTQYGTRNKDFVRIPYAGSYGIVQQS
jgi:hypothetical protein